MDYLSTLPEELLLAVASALKPKDQLHLALVSKRFSRIAVEALAKGAIVHQKGIPAYTALISRNPAWATSIRRAEIRASVAPVLPSRTRVECEQALEIVRQSNPSLVAGLEEVFYSTEMALGSDIQVCFLMLTSLLGNLQHLTLMLHADIVFDVGRLQLTTQLKLQSLSILCTWFHEGPTLSLQDFRSVRSLQVSGDVLARIPGGEFPPSLEKLCVFARSGQGAMVSRALRGLAACLQEVRFCVVNYDYVFAGSRYVDDFATEVRGVLASSSVTVRVFYTQECLGDRDQFDAEMYPAEV